MKYIEGGCLIFAMIVAAVMILAAIAGPSQPTHGQQQVPGATMPRPKTALPPIASDWPTVPSGPAPGAPVHRCTSACFSYPDKRKPPIGGHNVED